MKLFIMTLLVSLSYSTFASTITARNMSCGDIQSVLRSKGVVTIKYRFGRGKHYASRGMCSRLPRRVGESYRAIPANVRAADRVFCSAGYKCRKVIDSDD